MRSINRRALLDCLATFGAMSVLGGQPVAGAGEFGSGGELSRVMRYPLSSARAIGAAYLRVVPEEASIALLEEQLWNAVLGGETLTSVALRERFEKQIRDDFAAGEMVAVDGWMLARTEARLCALVALTS